MKGVDNSMKLVARNTQYKALPWWKYLLNIVVTGRALA